MRLLLPAVSSQIVGGRQAHKSVKGRCRRPTLRHFVPVVGWEFGFGGEVGL